MRQQLRRKIVYSLFLIIPAFALGGFLLWQTQGTPTCFDGEQNQGERGIDCGGPCEMICEKDTRDISISWVRTFAVTDSVYNTLAYIKNPNIDLTARDVPYTFTIYGEDNTVIKERKGTVTIPPQRTFAIFESGIQLPDKTPARTTFSFDEKLRWTRSEANRSVSPNIVGKTLSELDTSPQLDATVENPSLEPISDIRLIAILYGQNGNAINISRTVVERIAPETAEDIVFTWPNSFNRTPVRIEILPVSFQVGE